MRNTAPEYGPNWFTSVMGTGIVAVKIGAMEASAKISTFTMMSRNGTMLSSPAISDGSSSWSFVDGPSVVLPQLYFWVVAYAFEPFTITRLQNGPLSIAYDSVGIFSLFYQRHPGADFTEPEFLQELTAATGCGLLMDVNNVFVCASNHDFDAEAYLRAVPWDHVVYFHLAGHTVYPTHRLDTHDHPVCKEVWQLYRLAHRLSGGRSTLLEWDANVPDFARRLIDAFWPGPLTLILHRRPGVGAAAAGGQDSIGLRCPSHPVAQAVLRACAAQGVFGLAAPSANPFGRVSPTTAAHVQAGMGDALLVIDGTPYTAAVGQTVATLQGKVQLSGSFGVSAGNGQRLTAAAWDGKAWSDF